MELKWDVIKTIFWLAFAIWVNLMWRNEARLSRNEPIPHLTSDTNVTVFVTKKGN